MTSHDLGILFLSPFEIRNQAEVARLLMSKGANADLLNNAKCTALYVAVNKGFMEVVRALCEHGCDVNLPVGHFTFMPLVAAGFFSTYVEYDVRCPAFNGVPSC